MNWPNLCEEMVGLGLQLMLVHWCWPSIPQRASLLPGLTGQHCALLHWRSVTWGLGGNYLKKRCCCTSEILRAKPSALAALSGSVLLRQVTLHPSFTLNWLWRPCSLHAGPGPAVPSSSPGHCWLKQPPPHLDTHLVPNTSPRHKS